MTGKSKDKDWETCEELCGEMNQFNFFSWRSGEVWSIKVPHYDQRQVRNGEQGNQAGIFERIEFAREAERANNGHHEH